MDCGPLNLVRSIFYSKQVFVHFFPFIQAHFYERRAEKLLQRHNYEEAQKAIKNSLLYLEDVRKTVRLTKSLEVLETQKWEYERKLLRIEQYKQQFERKNIKNPSLGGDGQMESVAGDILVYDQNTKPNCETLIAPTAQQIAKSIDKTIRDFESMQRSCILDRQKHLQNKAKCTVYSVLSPLQIIDSATTIPSASSLTITDSGQLSNHAPTQQPQRPLINDEIAHNKDAVLTEQDDDLPSLVPLELPTFDYSAFQNSGLVAIPPYSKD